MLRALSLSSAALALSFLGVGCGPTCQSTCNKLYQESECGLTSPDDTTTELLNRCMDECENALEQPGEVPEDYKPDEQTPASVSVTLENDKQAAVWMDCVEETACEFLADGYCAPVW